MSRIVWQSGPDEFKKKSFLFLGQTRLVAPELIPDAKLFILFSDRNGKPETYIIESEEKRLEYEVKPNTFFYYVSTACFEIIYEIEDLIRSKEDLVYSVEIKGNLKILNSKIFLEKVAIDYVSSHSDFDVMRLESWFFDMLSPSLRDEFADIFVEDFRNKETHPSKWWKTKLNELAEYYGFHFLSISVEAINSDADRIRAKNERNRFLKTQLESEKKANELELEMLRMQAELQTEKDKIQHEFRADKIEREHRLGLIEQRFKQETMEAKIQIEEAEKSAQIASVQYDEVVAKYQENEEALGETRTKLEKLEKEHRESENKLSKLMETIQKIGSSMFGKLASGNDREIYQTLERLTSPEFEIEPWELAAIGYNVSHQMLVNSVRKKRQLDGNKVTIEKKDIFLRDIGIKKVKALAINQSLAFKVKSNTSGYVTALNLGTSGKYIVLVPNIWISPEKARSTAGSTYTIPGPDFLPIDLVGGMYEQGPSGWEHLAVLVSSTPIINSEISSRSTLDNPFVVLTDSEVKSMFQLLDRLDPDAWTGDILSFLVG